MSFVQSIGPIINRFTELTQAVFLTADQANLRGHLSALDMRLTTTYGQRVKLAMEHAGLNQKQLASRVGMSASNLSELIKQGHGSAKTVQIAKVAGVNPRWLATGEGEMLDTDDKAQISVGRVPLVSSVAAGMFTEAMDLMPAGFADEWIHSAAPIKEHTFALKVEGDSMEPRFTEGMILIVEPDSEPRPGNFVIAKNGNNEATFKQLMRDGGKLYLKPLNPRYPIHELGEASIVGVVIAAQVDLL